MSKAAHDKSSNTSIVVHFLSSAVAMSFFTRMSAVSVQWPARYADWNGSRSALSSRWSFKYTLTEPPAPKIHVHTPSTANAFLGHHIED